MPTVNEMLALVRSLPIPKPWDCGTFIESLSRVRGRQITLFPYEGGPPSLLLVRETDDLIGYDIATSEGDWDQLVFHHVGHLLLEHRSCCDRLFPDLNAATVRDVLGFDSDDDREDSDDDREHAADMFAALVRMSAQP